MKNLNVIVIVVFSILFMMSCNKETIIPESKIPSEIKTYVETHFSASTIFRAVKDKDGTDLYEITLLNGVKLEFNKQKEIVDIDWNAKLPDSVIPNNMISYVKSNYSSNFIIGWELQSGNQEVQLNNNIVLVFNMSGTFLTISD